MLVLDGCGKSNSSIDNAGKSAHWCIPLYEPADFTSDPMLKQSNLIILDEATAYADPESEAQIQEAVGRLVHGKTLVVVAHRLSTIQNAEQILVVDKGNIIARGTQKELLEQCPLYHRMWQQYVGASNLEKKEG